MQVVLAQMSFGQGPIGSLDDSYPMGLGYLHSALQEHGHSVTTLPLAFAAPSEAVTSVLEIVHRLQPQIVGFQILTTNRRNTFECIDRLHELHPSTTVLIGGPHVRELYRAILSRRPWILAVPGEGERVIVDVADRLAKGEDPRASAGVASVEGSFLRDNPPPPTVELEHLPFLNHGPFIASNASQFASMMSTRGCPFTCSFCAVARRPMRMREVSRVVDEIERVADSYPQVGTIRFFDDQMFFDNDRVIELCNEIVRRRVDLHFTAMARLRPCSAELVSALEDANFTEISFGLETGSPSVARKMGKGIRPRDALHTVSLFKDSPIRLYMFLIVGLEGETSATVEETADLFRDIQSIKYIPGSATGIATVYPGTDLYRRMLETGRMTESYWDDSDSVPLFTLEHSETELFELQRQLVDRIDPDRIFVSVQALSEQSGSLLSLAAYVAEQLHRPPGPRCSELWLGKYANWLSDALLRLEQQGSIRIRIRDQGISSRNCRPTLNLADQDGHTFVCVFDSSGPPSRTFLPDLAAQIARSDKPALRALLQDALRDTLLDRLARPATPPIDEHLSALAFG